MPGKKDRKIKRKKIENTWNSNIHKNGFHIFGPANAEIATGITCTAKWDKVECMSIFSSLKP